MSIPEETKIKIPKHTAVVVEVEIANTENEIIAMVIEIEDQDELIEAIEEIERKNEEEKG